jgi:23S rRNA pseudouridine1911/1915/1917 synthase
MPEREVLTDRGDAGQRIDLVLRRHLSSDVTRTRVQTWIAAGRVMVNGAIVQRVARRVAAGDRIIVMMPAAIARATMKAEERALEVLFEDEHFLVVNKPAGVVVHPTYRHTEGTLINALLWHARRWSSDQRPSIVGRLDKLTSGLVVVAKSTAVHAMLQKAMSSARCEKDYLAIVEARVNRVRGTIEWRLARDSRDRRRVVASPTGGVASETRFERLGAVSFEGRPLSLLRCRLITGRMHQIRVHLAANGWPILGDAVYGRQTANDLVKRQALHAWRLAVAHPIHQSPVLVTAPLPEDLTAVLDRTGLARCGPRTS